MSTRRTRQTTIYGDDALIDLSANKAHKLKTQARRSKSPPARPHPDAADPVTNTDTTTNSHIVAVNSACTPFTVVTCVLLIAFTAMLYTRELSISFERLRSQLPPLPPPPPPTFLAGFPTSPLKSLFMLAARRLELLRGP